MSAVLGLLAAHMVADFPLQTKTMNEKKHDIFVLKLGHVTVHFLVAYVVLFLSGVPGDVAVHASLTVGALHLVVDSIPRKWFGADETWYVGACDQSLHVLSLWIVAVIFL